MSSQFDYRYVPSRLPEDAEFVADRIQQWESVLEQAEGDVLRSESALKYWRKRQADDAGDV